VAHAAMSVMQKERTHNFDFEPTLLLISGSTSTGCMSTGYMSSC
jgi:hypothetical protein